MNCFKQIQGIVQPSSRRIDLLSKSNRNQIASSWNSPLHGAVGRESTPPKCQHFRILLRKL